MRTVLGIFIIIICVCFSSCKKDDTEPFNSEVEFALASFGNSQRGAANLDDGDPVPVAIIVSIEDAEGDEVYNREKINLLRFGNSFVSEKLDLLAGDFSLTEFFVLDSNDEVVYATPKEGSAFAQLVDNPLDIEFSTVDKTVTEVQVEVIKSELANPDSFGYPSFELDIVGTIDIQVAVSAYDDATQQLQLTTAELIITDNNGNDVAVALGDSTNVIRLRDNLDSYIFILNKDDYTSEFDTLSFAELTNYEVGKTAYKATLIKCPCADYALETNNFVSNALEKTKVEISTEGYGVHSFEYRYCVGHDGVLYQEYKALQTVGIYVKNARYTEDLLKATNANFTIRTDALAHVSKLNLETGRDAHVIGVSNENKLMEFPHGSWTTWTNRVISGDISVKGSFGAHMSTQKEYYYVYFIGDDGGLYSVFQDISNHTWTDPNNLLSLINLPNDAQEVTLAKSTPAATGGDGDDLYVSYKNSNGDIIELSHPNDGVWSKIN